GRLDAGDRVLLEADVPRSGHLAGRVGEPDASREELRVEIETALEGKASACIGGSTEEAVADAFDAGGHATLDAGADPLPLDRALDRQIAPADRERLGKREIGAGERLAERQLHPVQTEVDARPVGEDREVGRDAADDHEALRVDGDVVDLDRAS